MRPVFMPAQLVTKPAQGHRSNLSTTGEDQLRNRSELIEDARLVALSLGHPTPPLPCCQARSKGVVNGFDISAPGKTIYRLAPTQLLWSKYYG